MKLDLTIVKRDPWKIAKKTLPERNQYISLDCLGLINARQMYSQGN